VDHEKITLERLAALERHEAFRGWLVIVTGAGLLVLMCTLIRKGVLKPGDLRETLLGNG
jgi:hypothetical protein